MLIISKDNKKHAVRILAHAMKPENWYRPGPGVIPPGDRGDDYHVNFDGLLSVVFSFSVTMEKIPELGIKPRDVIRHLSVMSTRSKWLPPSLHRLHHRFLVWVHRWGELIQAHEDVIMRPGEDWAIMPHPRERTIVAVQKVPSEELAQMSLLGKA
jgi:hypothetical protein